MLTLTYHGHTLIGVPAIHNRAVFAEIVNRSCADSELRPSAVAVELDPAAVAAAAQWFTELGGLFGLSPLPCMLGLTRRNRRIHPRYREVALQLQERTGLQLHEMSPDLLHRELGFAAVSLLCLSPTDSIIEAIRCALELKVPLYGIDMDEPAVPAERPILQLRDPLAARNNFRAYIDLHGGLAEQGRDEHSDLRREIVMAARLKRLLMLHERVLFTCGLGHWRSICRLLADDSLQPASDVPQQGPVTYERILVHPQKAVAHMDIFPSITASYEVLRQPATCRTGRNDRVDFLQLFQNCLERACSSYSKLLEEGRGAPRSPEGSHGFGSFNCYLANLCLLSQMMVPNFFTALSAARSMMPNSFVTALADSLMTFDWASPAGFPDLPVICLPPDNTESGGGESTRAVMKIPNREEAGGQISYHESPPFHVAVMKPDQGHNVTGFPWQWGDEPLTTSDDKNHYEWNFVWPPRDNLFYATIYEAVNVAAARCTERRSEPFTCSLYDGIDLKGSLRSVISGKNRLFVKRTLKSAFRQVAGGPALPIYSEQLELQPTVFIFSRDAAQKKLSWQLLRPGDRDDVYHYLSSRGKRMIDEVVANEGDHFVESFNMVEHQDVPEQMKPWVRGLNLLYGCVRFGNPCVNFYQAAAWLEKGRFRATPILRHSWEIDEAVTLYRERHHLAIDLEEWRDALILFALPYARTTRRIVVVAPKEFRIGEGVRREARRRKIEIVTLPLSYFPAERVRHMRTQYLVMARQGGTKFPPELERILGQRHTAHQNLLPRQIAAQTRPRR
jgi:hypothetical protein